MRDPRLGLPQQLLLAGAAALLELMHAAAAPRPAALPLALAPLPTPDMEQE